MMWWSKIFLARVGANWGDTHASGSPDPIGLRETANYELSQSSLPVDGSYDVLLRLDPAQRTQRDDVMQIDLPAQSGRVLAPLSQVAGVEEGDCAFKIRRRDLMRFASVPILKGGPWVK